MSDFTLSEHADISIERPERFGKQLASHISHKTEVSEIEGGWQAKIRTGEGKILPQTETLVLEAQAHDEETLAIVKDVLEHHLRKFAAKLEPFDVHWEKTSEV